MLEEKVIIQNLKILEKIMKIFYITLVFAILFSSCLKRNDIKDSSKVVVRDIKNDSSQLKTSKSADLEDNCIIDSLESQTSEYDGINFYTENTLRGKGIAKISIDQKLKFLNLDKTVFGSISILEIKNTYEMKFPKTVIAREILVDKEFQVLSFDAELPETDNNFIIVYINKEKKLLKKEGLHYEFLTLEEYIKSSFINLTENTDNVSKEERMYWYNVLEIKGDSMKIKSVNKSSCDYIEDYKDVTKWIKWRSDSCKLIKFNFCY